MSQLSCFCFQFNVDIFCIQKIKFAKVWKFQIRKKIKLNWLISNNLERNYNASKTFLQIRIIKCPVFIGHVNMIIYSIVFTVTIF